MTNQELINENISLKCIIALKDIQIEKLKKKTKLREISENFMSNFLSKSILTKN